MVAILGVGAASGAPVAAPSVVREARATWTVQRVLANGTVETTSYLFDVVQHVSAVVTDDTSGFYAYDQGGEATATSQVCTTTCGALATLTGPASIAPLGVATGENLFYADPAMRQATFMGTLRDDRDTACDFSVMWYATGTPYVAPSTTGVDARQAAQATLSGNCWGVLSQGEGSLATPVENGASPAR